MALSQVMGLVMLGPLAISLLQVEGGFVLIALLYLGAALSVSMLPPDKRPDRPCQSRHFGLAPAVG